MTRLRPTPLALLALASTLLCTVLALALAPPAGASVQRIRVFAVGPRLDPSWLESRATYRGKLLALVDQTQRPPGLVQDGAGDVASRELLGERNLVTFPEDLGLFSIFAGSRGAEARKASDVVGSIVALLGPYSDLIAYYTAKYPALAKRPLPTRALALAATDTFGRIAVETYAELARRLDAYVVGGAPMARSWQVVCVSKAAFVPVPGAEKCDVEDPAKVARLRSPDEPGRTYAYEATSADAVNLGLVFDPKGRLISKQVKTYLTPIELEDQLDLVPGAPTGGLTAVETPVGRIGVVTSKDAWMPDVTSKLDEERVDVLVQPEFFEGNLISRTGFWQADNLKASGYSDVLRHPSMEAMVMPQMTGRVFGVQADAQSHVVRKPRGTRAKRRGLVGQPEDFGWGSVSPWVVDDPLSRSESLDARRRRLGDAGAALLPGGPACLVAATRGPCRDGHVERVIAEDVDVRRRPELKRTPRRKIGTGGSSFSPAIPISPSGREQRNVSVSAHGSTVWAAFEERTANQRDRVVVARSRDGGRTWGAPIRLSDRFGTGNARSPSVSMGVDGEAWFAWQEDRKGVPRVVVARASRTRSVSFTTPREIAAGTKAAQRRPSIAATKPGQAYVAWIDEREKLATGAPKAAVQGASVAVGRAPSKPRSLDTGKPVKLAASLDHDWAPSVGADGDRVAVSWLSFKTYDWRVFARSSSNAGASFGPVRPVGVAPTDRESLDDTPRTIVDGSEVRVAFTDFTARPESSTDLSPHPLYNTVIAAPGGKNGRVDDQQNAQVSTFSPSAASLGRGAAFVAWQDHGTGVARIRASPVSASGVRGRPVRVDDNGSTGANAWRPAVTIGRSRVVVAWEDERDGQTQAYVATSSLAGPR